MNIDWKRKLTSRKFWVAVASAVFIILSEGLGWNIDKDVYWKIVAIAIRYIFGEAYVDGKKIGGLKRPRFFIASPFYSFQSPLSFRNRMHSSAGIAHSIWLFSAL